MNNKIGLSNISMSTDGVDFTPICSAEELNFTMYDEEDIPEWAKIDPTKSVSLSMEIRPKKNGSLLERCLYYSKSKKKRIRKKYKLERILFKKKKL